MAGGGCTWLGGGDAQGGRGDACASCASPLGTPLPITIRSKVYLQFFIDHIFVLALHNLKSNGKIYIVS